MVLVVGVVDYVTGSEISVTLLYLAPICWSAWFANRNAGVFVAITCALTWLAVDQLDRASVGLPWVPVWNTLMLAGIFAVVAVILAALNNAKNNLEVTVAKRTAELQRAQLQLVEAARMETVGRMAAGVAHEVKNPLMTLGLAADYFLLRKPANADEAALLQDMKEAVQRASNIINLMLDFSKPRPLQLDPADLNALVEHSLGMVRHQLLKQRINVVLALQPELPTLALDRTRMEHVLINLFTNAAQAMPDGGTLTVRSRLQKASGTSTGTEAILDVEDTGSGIPAQHLSKIFEPFYTTKPPGQGTGLGLSIVQKILQIHGASITLGNRPEGGARATLTFKLQPIPQP